MGYTNYWGREKPATKSDLLGMYEIARIVEDEPIFGQFVQHPKDASYPGMGLSDARGRLFFVLNGYCSEKEDLGHESLSVEEGETRGFCKTARKPYDLTVVAVMAAWHITGYVDKTDSDSGVENFARNWEAILRYSCEECLPCWEDDPTVQRLYHLPDADTAVSDFRKVIDRLEEWAERRGATLNLAGLPKGPIALDPGWLQCSNWF